MRELMKLSASSTTLLKSASSRNSYRSRTSPPMVSRSRSRAASATVANMNIAIMHTIVESARPEIFTVSHPPSPQNPHLTTPPPHGPDGCEPLPVQKVVDDKHSKKDHSQDECA